MSFREEYCASRRTFILRLLVEYNGEANESTIYRATTRAGFAASTRDDIRADLDHLKAQRCLSEMQIGETLFVAKITDRGEDAACGKIDVPGVERSRWSPAA